MREGRGLKVTTLVAEVLAEQHDLGERQRGGMGDRHECACAAEHFELASSTAMKDQPGRAILPDDLDVTPRDSAAVPRPKRLHGRLLGGKPCREVRRRIAAPGAVRDFAIGEDSPQEPITEPSNRFIDASNLLGIDSNPDNSHDATTA